MAATPVSPASRLSRLSRLSAATSAAPASPGRAPRKAAEPGAATPKRDADATRARILEVAIREFAAHGYNGARVEAICKGGKINPRMIYHYFGDKAGLYVAALEHVLGELRHAELGLDVDGITPLEGMVKLFHFIHRHFGKHPELISLLAGENLLRARFLARSKEVPRVASPLIETITRLLRRGEESGTFRGGIDPLALYVSMVALSSFHRSNVHTLSSIFRRDLHAPEWQATQRSFAVDMIARVLLRDPV